MIQTETDNYDGPTLKRRPRRRLLRNAAGAAIIAGAVGSGLLIANVSAATRPALTHNSGGATGEARQGVAFQDAPGGTPPAVVGTVESVDASGDSFTVKDQAGTTITVDVTSSTIYHDPKVSSATVSDITVGKQVAVIGTASSGIVTATQVLIGGPPGGHGPGGGPGFGPGGTPPAVVGTVESVDASGDSFTVKDQAGTTITVDVTSSTIYHDPKVSSATVSDITVGKQVAVIGTASSGIVTATQVLIGGPPGGHGPGGGPGFGPGGTAGPSE